MGMNSTTQLTAETNEVKANQLREEMKKALDAVTRINGDVGKLIRSNWWLDRAAQLEAWQSR